MYQATIRRMQWDKAKQGHCQQSTSKGKSNPQGKEGDNDVAKAKAWRGGRGGTLSSSGRKRQRYTTMGAQLSTKAMAKVKAMTRTTTSTRKRVRAMRARANSAMTETSPRGRQWSSSGREGTQQSATKAVATVRTVMTIAAKEMTLAARAMVTGATRMMATMARMATTLATMSLNSNKYNKDGNSNNNN